MKHYLFIIFFLILCLLIPVKIFAFPSNNWKHISSKNFILSYNEKTKQIAEKALEIAEDTAAIIGDYFGYDITKTSVAIVLKDHNDYYNGDASRYIPLVNIECRKTDSFYRNDSKWLRKILSHELSHIYTLRLMQLPLIMQLGVTSENDDDGKQAFFTYRHKSLPLWFVEGIAQLGSYECKSDYRDPFREMLLRDAFQNDLLLSLKEMERFEGTSREYELVYNQGFDFILYLIKNYPNVSMKSLCKKIKNVHMNYAFKILYNKTISVLFDEWKDSLKKRFPIKKDIIDGNPLYKLQNRNLTTERASVNNGKYAIANWLHDYNKFDLFIMSNKKLSKKKYIQKIIKDSGQILKYDQSNVYFTKEVYNRETGVVNYDVFMINSFNKIKQITFNKRCMAFDVKDNHLIFAAYKNGITSIILQKPDQSIQKLMEFQRNTSIYNISIINNDSIVLSLSEKNRRTMGILKNNTLERPWENFSIDVFDIIYAYKGRYVFTSTIDGSPQLYWCNLEKDKNIWYKITDVSGGARYPGFDRKTKQLICSIYAKGNSKLYFLNNPFKKEYPINISSYNKSNKRIAESNSEPSTLELNKKIFANIIFHTPVFYLLIDNEKENISSDNFYEISKNIISPGVQIFAKNAPSNFEVYLDTAINLPVEYKTESKSFPSIDLALKFDIKKLRIWGEFKEDSSLNEYKRYNLDILEKHKISSYATILSYQLFKDDFINLRIEKVNRKIQFKYKLNNSFSFGPSSYDGPEEKLYSGLISSLSWQHQQSTHMLFDPADLGNPYFQMIALVSMYKNKNYDIGLFDPKYYNLDNDYIYKFLYGLSYRDMYFLNSFSAKLAIDGFIYFGEKESNKISPFMYEIFGRESLFSGYSNDILSTELHRIYGEFKFNPFLNIKNNIRWYERVNCGIKIEAGYSKYFETDYENIYPVSCEISLRYGFYFWPDRKGKAYIKYARPLKSIDNISDTSSYRIYLGLSI